jgi:hypothetical protein
MSFPELYFLLWLGFVCVALLGVARLSRWLDERDTRRQAR